MEGGIAPDGLPLELELNNGDRLVHARGTRSVHAGLLGGFEHFGQEAGNVAAAIGLVREQRERAQADAVAGFDHIQIVIGDRVAQYGCDASAAAGGRAHPQHIVVAPLDIDRVMVHQQVHDDIRARTAVKNVAHNMQMIDHQPLDEVAHRDDEFLGAVGFDDRGNDCIEVFTLVVNVVILVEKLVDDVTIPARQRAAHLGARVLGGTQAADLKQTAERDAIPFGAVG